MSQDTKTSGLTISETGLKLIKAYEGYRPVDRELVTGQRVVGYGHRLYSEDAKQMNKADAEETLRLDLEPFEDMINTQVHAPITQGQFDALCSFAFNIGPKAFLTSDTLRALNNGRPLDAANGFDIWRKSEIAGKTYVVDALMRRRTAEKALFLRTERHLTAGREDLPPVADTTIASLSTEDALPVFTADDANGVVATAPHEAKVIDYRRREDGPSGTLSLSEIDLVDDEIDASVITTDAPEERLVEDTIIDLDSSDVLADAPSFEVEPDRPSPIAAAATDIVARLDALIDDASDEEDRDTSDWPESLITTETGTEKPDDVDLYDGAVLRDDAGLKTAAPIPVTKKPASKSGKPVLVIDELAQDDAFRQRAEGQRVRTDSAAKYIQSVPPVTAVTPVVEKDGAAGLWIPVLLGFLLIGCSGAAMLRGAQALLGAWGPVLVFSGLVIGMGLVLMGVYAALKMNLRD